MKTLLTTIAIVALLSSCNKNKECVCQNKIEKAQVDTVIGNKLIYDMNSYQVDNYETVYKKKNRHSCDSESTIDIINSQATVYNKTCEIK